MADINTLKARSKRVFFSLLQQYFFVRAGSSNIGSGGQRIAVSEIIQHSSYNRTSYNNDLTILKVGLYHIMCDVQNVLCSVKVTSSRNIFKSYTM